MDICAYVPQEAVRSNTSSSVVISDGAIQPPDPMSQWNELSPVSVPATSKGPVMLFIYYEGEQPADLAKIEKLAREALGAWIHNNP